ncbi:MAG TPA: phosphatidylserine decarboxylase [Methylococcaceae bacterium]|nr:phosphatidylserine decarboxylase [Methylococcaceae bacterium]HIB63289.1 phosphatidylserine decarboxylase [Methylococcaceae bacterium]HIN69046.1 phosphatidylserine decarboxylase [Methylococcales bacterium]HIO13263.1 phosphatidylserine decarboxylase [Methylococcales bacterium]HIO44036.1 phosphatidylserine decarboxylase [Methylococcales bacterium]
MALSKQINASIQALLPHHLLSRLMRLFTESTFEPWKNFAIKLIIKHYQVNMNEAINSDPTSYRHFNAFFTRTLKPDTRPVCQEPHAIISPADGAISQIGTINNDQIIQAKGKNFSAKTLLGGDTATAEIFKNGQFITIYLSPKDYHRLHMPVTGTLKEMIHIPGRLFSVNTATTEAVPNLFARNERVVTIYETESGPMALIQVGAIFVSSIETVWHGVVTPPSSKTIRRWQYPDNPPTLKFADEMGRFNMGSTIIVLFGQDQMNWLPELNPGENIQLGQQLGVAYER